MELIQDYVMIENTEIFTETVAEAKLMVHLGEWTEKEARDYIFNNAYPELEDVVPF